MREKELLKKLIVPATDNEPEREAAKFVLLFGKANDVINARVVTRHEAFQMKLNPTEPESVRTFLVGEFVHAFKTKNDKAVQPTPKENFDLIMVYTTYTFLWLL